MDLFSQLGGFLKFIDRWLGLTVKIFATVTLNSKMVKLIFSDKLIDNEEGKNTFKKI